MDPDFCVYSKLKWPSHLSSLPGKLAHNKKQNLERHFTTKHVSFSIKYPVGDARKKAVEELQKSQEKSRSVFNYGMQSSNNVHVASSVVSQGIAKRGKPYTDGECIKSCFVNASEELFRDFKNKADILKKKIKELPLSAKTVKDRTVKMSSNITDQHVEDLKLVSALSIAVDESCDINDTAQVSLFAGFISSTGPKEELLGLLPLKGQTRGEAIASAVIEWTEKHHIPLNKIVSISTDGARSMTGVRNGFVAILEEKINHKILTYHCITHQEALCVQTFPEEICKVMELVINIINSIIAKALNHRQFKEFLVEMESEYPDLLHNKVCWLTRGNVLKRFASLLTEIKAFLLEKGVHYPELTNDQWIQKLYFMVDVMSHLNQLNRKLQGKGNTIFSMLEEVISFENKLSLFAQDFERETLIHFPSLLKHRQENNSDIDICYFKTTLLNMREAFLNRFQEFRNSKATLAFVKKPLNAIVTELNFSPFNIDISNFEMQSLDLKNKELWSSKFGRLCADREILEKTKCELSSQHRWSALKDLEKEGMLIFNTWNSVPDSYNQLKKLAFAVLSLFGSTYLCEQSFSSMNLIRSKLRSRLTDENLESCLKLKTTTYKPDLPQHPRRCKAIVHISVCQSLP